MKITKGKAEIVGIYIGDGYIYKNGNKYQIGFVGNPITDVSLFERVKKLIKKEWNKEVSFKVRDSGLRMVFRSKEVSGFLIGYLKLPFGKGKCERVVTPEVIAKDWNLAKYTIRGIMDTDGTVFISKKPRIDKYPAMEITTTSQLLADQLREILLKQEFRVGNIRKSTSKLSKLPAYRVALYGRDNLRKWVKEIGFSNKYKLDRAKDYIQ